MVRGQPPPPPPARQHQQQHAKHHAPPPPPRTNTSHPHTNGNVVAQSAATKIIAPNVVGNQRIYTPEEFERSQLFPPPPKLQQEKSGGSSSAHGSKPMIGYQMKVPTKQCPSTTERSNHERSASSGPFSSRPLTRSKSRDSLPIRHGRAKSQEYIPTTQQQRKRSKSQDGLSRDGASQDCLLSLGASLGAAWDDHGKSSTTLNFGDVMSALIDSQNDLEGQALIGGICRGDGITTNDHHHQLQYDNGGFMTKTWQQLSHAQEVIAQANNNPNNTSSANNDAVVNATDSKAGSGTVLYHKGFREDYALGDTARVASHMIIETNPERAIDSIDTLGNHDFAWVKRSDGTYSYSILAYRSSSGGGANEADEDDDEEGQAAEERMTFVLSNLGCTKVISKSQWGKCIRLVAPEDAINARPSSPMTQPPEHINAEANDKKTAADHYQQEQPVKPNHEEYLKKIRQEFYSTRKGPAVLQPGDPGWVPPTTVAFNTDVDDDLISCISTPVGIPRDDDVDKKAAATLAASEKYTLSQPVILE